MQKEYIEREILQKAINTEISEHAEDAKESLYERGYNNGLTMAYALLLKAPAADVVEADRLGRVGRLMLPNKGCPRGPIGRLGMAGGKTQDKKAILVEELCCMDTFEDVDGNVWRPVQEEVLQEVIEMLRNMEETVHCKDCDVPHNRWIGCRNLNGLIPPPDFYCAYGERKIDKEE